MSRSDLICYCFSVTEGELGSAIAAGARTLAALRTALGVTTCCGSCEHRVRDCLQDATGVAPAGLLNSLQAVPPYADKSSTTSRQS